MLSVREREVVVGPSVDAPRRVVLDAGARAKVVKNRLHLDLSPVGRARDEEVDRLLALGASRVDVGQTGEESWTVLADPEGNEF